MTLLLSPFMTTVSVVATCLATLDRFLPPMSSTSHDPQQEPSSAAGTTWASAATQIANSPTPAGYQGAMAHILARTARSVPREPVRAHEVQRLSHKGHDKVLQDTPVLQEHGLTGTSLVRTDVVTPLNAEEFARELCSHLDNAWVTRLLNGIQFGFHIGYSGPRHSILACNLPSATQHPEVIDKELGKKVCGRPHLRTIPILSFA